MVLRPFKAIEMVSNVLFFFHRLFLMPYNQFEIYSIIRIKKGCRNILNVRAYF